MTLFGHKMIKDTFNSFALIRVAILPLGKLSRAGHCCYCDSVGAPLLTVQWVPGLQLGRALGLVHHEHLGEGEGKENIKKKVEEMRMKSKESSPQRVSCPCEC